MPLYKVGDVVSTTYRKQMIIVEIRPRALKWPYVAKIDSPRASTGEYKLGDHVIIEKVGETTVEARPREARISDEEITRGQRYAAAQAHFASDDDKPKWEHLATLSPEDEVTVSVYGKPEVCSFIKVKTMGRKYHFVVKRPTGGRYKFSISQLLVP